MDYSEIGKRVIENSDHRFAPVPLQSWSTFPLHFAIEYRVSDFQAEVGFMAKILGLRFLSLNREYALCTDIDRRFTFAFQYENSAALPNVRLQWFTGNLDETIRFLEEQQASFEILQHSANQRIVRMSTPNGAIVEIWSGWEDTR